MILRKNFLSLVLLAPLAKLVGYEAPIDLSKVKLTKTMGQVEMTGDVWRKIRPNKDAYEATMVTYHQRLLVKRSGMTSRAEGSYIPDPEFSASGR